MVIYSPDVVSTEQFLGIALASVLIIVVPGPSVLFLIGQALSYGRRTALASMAGNSLGSYVAAIVIAFGLGPVLQRSATLLLVVKLLGAAYLVWLGIQAIRHSKPAEGEVSDRVAPSTLQSLRTGLIVGVTNPKVFILFAAILPHFIDPARGNVPAQMLLLALVPVAIGIITDSVWALAAGAARTWFTTSPRRTTMVGRAGGVSMIGLGIVAGTTSH